MEVEIRRMSNDVRKWPVSDKILKKGWIQVHSRMCEAEETGLNPLEPGHLGSQDQKRKVGRWIFQLPTVGAHSKGIHKLGLKGEGHHPSLLKWCEKWLITVIRTAPPVQCQKSLLVAVECERGWGLGLPCSKSPNILIPQAIAYASWATEERKRREGHQYALILF